MNTRQYFERIVDNAFDFLSSSIAEIHIRPKYSLVHFHTAVELFLKARLLEEHWTLVVAKGRELDWDQFVSGDFRSVPLEEAATRLTKVVRSGLTDPELAAFRKISQHRNRMVHFVHDLDDQEKNENFVRLVAKQQLNAWYFLHGLLTRRWKDIFYRWSKKVEEIDTNLRGYHEFLQVVFENVQCKIQDRTKSGFVFRECPSCGFESHEHISEFESLYDSRCFVCGHEETNLRIKCTSCSTSVWFANEGFSECTSCGTHYEPDSVVEALLDHDRAHLAAQDGDDSWDLGNCNDCDGYHTVFRMENDQYFCASCFGEFDSMMQCGWCADLNTGDMEHSYVTGCNHCEGLVGWHKDD